MNNIKKSDSINWNIKYVKTHTLIHNNLNVWHGVRIFSYKMLSLKTMQHDRFRIIILLWFTPRDMLLSMFVTILELNVSDFFRNILAVTITNVKNKILLNLSLRFYFKIVFSELFTYNSTFLNILNRSLWQINRTLWNYKFKHTV